MVGISQRLSKSITRRNRYWAKNNRKTSCFLQFYENSLFLENKHNNWNNRLFFKDFQIGVSTALSYEIVVCFITLPYNLHVILSNSQLIMWLLFAEFAHSTSLTCKIDMFASHSRESNSTSDRNHLVYFSNKELFMSQKNLISRNCLSTETIIPN